MDMTRELLKFLRELWDEVVSPIVEIPPIPVDRASGGARLPSSRFFYCMLSDQLGKANRRSPMFLFLSIHQP
jgi:hypothetical protein